MMSDSEYEFSAAMELSDDIFNEDFEDSWSPCDGCEPNYINACSGCRFASPEINESLRYSDEG